MGEIRKKSRQFRELAEGERLFFSVRPELSEHHLLHVHTARVSLERHPIGS